MKEEFLQKLKGLLIEYRVNIGFQVDDASDTHCLYDERIVFSHQTKDCEEEDWLVVDGWSVSANDIPATMDDNKMSRKMLK